LKIYLAGSTGDLEFLHKLDEKEVLVTYPLVKDKKEWIQPSYFLDSGAFSAFTRGAKIDIQQYIQFIKDNKISIYASLDVIGDAKKSYENYLIMRQAGLRPIPAFHYGEDFAFFEEYLETEDYVAIGGVAQLKMTDRLIPFLDKCFRTVHKYWPKKIHGFAITRTALLKRYPFYSVDSTSWIVPRKFAEMNKFHKGQLFRIKKRHSKPLTELLDGNERNRREIKEMRKQEEYITRMWEKRGITFAP